MQRPLTTRLITGGALGLMLAACLHPQEWPSDLRVETLDAPVAVGRSDSIILAIPLNRRDIREFATPWKGDADAKRLAEVETTLKVIQVIKGSGLPQEVRFRFYDGRGYTFVTGMPKGPSVQIGSVGIFFLEERPNGIFRSSVDIYRPDIAVPWLSPSEAPEPCTSPQECVAGILLGYHGHDHADAFTAALAVNAGLSRRLTFFGAFERLTRLAAAEENPTSVRRAACAELTGSYEFDIPPACGPLIDGSQDAADFTLHAAALRERLRSSGLDWVHRRVGSADADTARRYLHLLSTSHDDETRSLALSLLANLR